MLQDGFLQDVGVDEGGRETRVVGGKHEGVVSHILGVVSMEGQQVEDMPLVDPGIQSSAREGRHCHQGRQMLLLPVLDEIVPGQEHRLKLSVADFHQADTAKCLSPSTSPEWLHEAADNFVRKAWSSRILLENREQEGAGIGGQEQVKQIVSQGMLTVVDPGD
jgi:hypothetical protein